MIAMKMKMKYVIFVIFTVGCFLFLISKNQKHFAALEHKNKELVLSLRADNHLQNESYFKVIIDFYYDTDLKDVAKSKLVENFQNTAAGSEKIQVEVDNPKIAITINKGQITTNKGILKDDKCFDVSISMKDPNSSLCTCIPIEKGTNWFNAFELTKQYWPMEKIQINKRALTPTKYDNQAIAEPYFLNSKGSFIYFSPNMTAYININSGNDKVLEGFPQKGQFCVYSEKDNTYIRNDTHIYLNFTTCKFKESKEAHRKALDYFLGHPRELPDFKMIQFPVWTTWAKYKVDINHSIVLDYARSININGFSNSQLEIDDDWEICYGSAKVNTTKFPDFKDTISELKKLGFRVTLWIHPFVNKNCLPYFENYEHEDLFVKNQEGSIYTTWWNSGINEAAHFDFTRSETASWFSERLLRLREQYGIDSFKFDAGESTWAPQIPILNCPDDEHPRCLTKAYVTMAHRFGGMIEVRTGAQTQYLPSYVRMLDRNSNWGYQMGLPTLITAVLMMNIAGYPFVMPDMIGGNVYNGEKCSEELFIRWTQANTFMPIMQFSIPPWDYSKQAIDISKKYVQLHSKYADKIFSLMKKAVEDGSPVNPPIWWIDPENPNALACCDEYLLGEDILVAPVITEGATSRDIYLPAGKWRDEVNVSHIIQGPFLLKDYPAPLEVLPYFTRIP